MCTYGTVYFVCFCIRKEKKNPSKTCCFTTGFELEKNEEKKRGGVLKKIQYPPLRFRKIRTFKEIQVYTMSGKCLKYIQKKFCCLKIIICTHSCTRLWHQGIIAIFCRIWKQKFRFLEKKNVPDVLQSIFIYKFAQKYLIFSYV